MGDKIIVRGQEIDQAKLRAFLDDINIENIDQFQTEDGYWKSPVTGDLFETKWQLWGQLGAYLRKATRKDPKEPTRAGYVRALRSGLEPTPEQKKAHREYNREFRKRRRKNVVAETEVSTEEKSEKKPPRSIPKFSWD